MIFSLDGYNAELMEMDDIFEIKELFEKCSDYFIRLTGQKAWQGDAEKLFTSFP